MSVFPQNWNIVRANVKLTWYIKYRFYDDNLKQNRQIVLKGMNTFTRLQEKQLAVKMQLKDELDLILNKGYNRITDTYSIAQPETEPVPVAIH